MRNINQKNERRANGDLCACCEVQQGGGIEPEGRAGHDMGGILSSVSCRTQGIAQRSLRDAVVDVQL
jgi:hypothetical protein